MQGQAGFEPGECIVVWVESQAIRERVQQYKVIDAALGVIERGTWNVADAVNEQPWLPNGPIPLQVTWSRGADQRTGRTERRLRHDAGSSRHEHRGRGGQRAQRARRRRRPGPGRVYRSRCWRRPTRSAAAPAASEAIVPGLLHDHCSAVHPMAVGSPFLHGPWTSNGTGCGGAHPEIDCAHPLDGGAAGVLHRSVDETAAGLGRGRSAGGGGCSPARRPASTSWREDIMRPAAAGARATR